MYVLIFLASISQTACGRDLAQQGGSVVEKRDSSGVVILTVGGNAAPTELDLSSVSHVLRVDSLEIDELRQLRLAHLAPSGEVVLASTRPLRVVVFDSSGRPARQLGRAGDGPGEYRSVSALQRLPDQRISTFDIINRRLTEYQADGVVDGTATFATISERPKATLSVPAGVFSDGAVLVRVATPTPPASGLSRSRFEFARLQRDGDVRVLPGVFDGDEVFMGEPGKDGFAPIGVPPFGLKTLAAVCGDHSVVSSNVTPELRLLDSNGRLRRVLRARVSPQQLAEKDYTEYWKQNGLAEPSDTEIEQVRKMTHGDSLPALKSLYCDPSTSLLVELESKPTDSQRMVWHLSPTWEQITVFTIPSKVRVLSLSGDRMLFALQEDEARVKIGVVPIARRAP